MAKRKVQQRLAAAAGSETLMRIARAPRHADVIDGYVLGVGARWVLVEQISDGGYLDGMVALRTRDVVSIEPKLKTFEEVFSRTQPGWPPRWPTAIDLDKTRSLIEGLAALAPLVGIEQEDRFHEPMQWIGRVDEISDGWLWLHEIRPDATWGSKPTGYRLRRITKVEINNHYKNALAAVAIEPTTVAPPIGTADVHLVWHVHHATNRDGSPTEHRDERGEVLLNEDYDDAKLIGVYSSEHQAGAAVERTRLLDGFSAEPDCFIFDTYRLDQDHWIEGYVTDASDDA